MVDLLGLGGLSPARERRARPQPEGRPPKRTSQLEPAGPYVLLRNSHERKLLMNKSKQYSKSAPAQSRSAILQTAEAYVTKDRATEHGDMENNFATIASFWNTYLSSRFGISVSLEPHDVALLMGLLKIARAASNPKRMDNYIDLAGYAACGGECAEECRDASPR